MATHKNYPLQTLIVPEDVNTVESCVKHAHVYNMHPQNLGVEFWNKNPAVPVYNTHTHKTKKLLIEIFVKITHVYGLIMFLKHSKVIMSADHTQNNINSNDLINN